MIYVQNGSDLEKFCGNQNYSIDFLALELGVSRATIFNWKKDNRSLPRLVSLAIAALQLDPALSKITKTSEDKPMKQHRRDTHALSSQ